MQAKRKKRRIFLFVLVTASIVLILLVVAGALYYKMTGLHLPNQISSNVAQKLDPDAFPRAGRIVFAGSISNDQGLNPLKAEITDINFETIAITWQIRNLQTNHIIDSGPGHIVDFASTELATMTDRGEYLIDFFVADENYRVHGSSATFTIAPEIPG